MQVDSRVSSLVSISFNDIFTCWMVCLWRSIIALSAESWTESLAVMRSSVKLRRFSMSAKGIASSMLFILTRCKLFILTSMHSGVLVLLRRLLVCRLALLLLRFPCLLFFHASLHKMIVMIKPVLVEFRQDFNRALPVHVIHRHYSNRKSQTVSS